MHPISAMEPIVEQAGQTTDSTPSNMRGLSANPTPPSYHQHCPFRRLGKLIVGSSSGSMAIHLITDATSLRLGHCLIGSSFQRLKDIWWERVLSFNGIEFLQLSKDAFHPRVSSSSQFSDGSKGRTDGTSSPERPRKKSSDGRHMTNAIIAVNIFICWTTCNSGETALLGSSDESSHQQGTMVEAGHIKFLTCECRTPRDAIGPNVEALSGPKRFLMVYATSAIASSATSYWLTKAPSIGASGANLGLVGYMAVYIMRHRGLTGDDNEDLKYIARIIIINLVWLLIKLIEAEVHLGTLLSFSSRLKVSTTGDIRHLGGFLGGGVASWLLDPAGKLERRSSDGRDIINNIKGREDPAQPWPIGEV